MSIPVDPQASGGLFLPGPSGFAAAAPSSKHQAVSAVGPSRLNFQPSLFSLALHGTMIDKGLPTELPPRL